MAEFRSSTVAKCIGWFDSIDIRNTADLCDKGSHPSPRLLGVGRALGLARHGDLVSGGLVVLLVRPLDQHGRVLDDDAHRRRRAGAPVDVHRLAGVVAGVLVAHLK